VRGVLGQPGGDVVDERFTTSMAAGLRTPGSRDAVEVEAAYNISLFSMVTLILMCAERRECGAGGRWKEHDDKHPLSDVQRRQ
jgi:hypothetical protein